MSELWMSEYNSIYVSEETDVNKTIGSHECIICHNWWFQPKEYDGCQDLMQKVMLQKKRLESWFLYMSKDVTIDLWRNTNLIEISWKL